MTKQTKLVIGLWILFLFITLLHYFTHRPLWLDEQFVFDSIQSYNYAQIFGPLKTQQAFPRVYLIIVKAVADFFHHDLLALRFFSLVAMMTAFYVWQKNYQKQIIQLGLWLLCLLSFATSYRMAYYAAELKPYSMDVLVVGLYVLFLYYQNQWAKTSSIKLNILSFLMPFCMFFSYATLFVIWIPGWNFLLNLKDNRAWIKPFAIYSLSSILCLFILYQIDLKHFMYVDGYYSYWKNYFLGHNLKSFFTPFGEGYIEIGTWWFGESRLEKKLGMVFLPFLFYALVRYGWEGLKARGFKVVTLENIFGVLFLELVVFSLLGRYPFTGDRITLFFAPFVFYMILKAIEDLKPIRFLYYAFKSYYIFYLGFCFIHSTLHFLSLYRASP
jgi:hypothetical protein